MFHASDLEGEVDHSFFDSDCENTKDRGEGKDTQVQKQDEPSLQKFPLNSDECLGDGLSSKSEQRKKHLEQVVKMKKRASAPSSHSRTSDEAVGRKNNSTEKASEHSKSPSGAVKCSSGNTQGEDDVSSQSTVDLKEKWLPLGAMQKKRKESSFKKVAKSRKARSSSSSVVDASGDADSESSYSSRRSDLGSSTRSSYSTSGRSSRKSSASSRDRSNSSTDGTVTDVSPLSSPESRHLQVLDLNNSEVAEGSHEVEQRESVSSPGFGDTKQEGQSYQDLDETSFHLESRLGYNLGFQGPGKRYRKNYSFSNDEVRRIDHENHRLLRELSRVSLECRPGSLEGQKKQAAMITTVPPGQIASSTLNRKREHRRIAHDNLSFLKRLEVVKPTGSLVRTKQLADYKRHLGFPGYSPCSSFYSSTSENESAARSRTDERAASSATPRSKSKQPGPPRPAWC